jgi:hypothetical protein
MAGWCDITTVLGQASILITTDVARALADVNESLGFETTGIWDDPRGFAILKREGCRVMIGTARVPHTITPCWQVRPGLWNARFWVSDDAALFSQMRQRGATIADGLEDTPGGVRGFGVPDSDGHDIGFWRGA